MKEVGSVCLAHENCFTGYCKHGQCANNGLKKPCAGPKATCPQGTICHPTIRYCLNPVYLPPKLCVNPWNCPWGQYCEQGTQKCRNRILVGGECNQGEECIDGVACMEGYCRKRCNSDEDCPSQHCEPISDLSNAKVCLSSLDQGKRASDQKESSPDVLPVYIFLPLILLALLLIFLFIWMVYKFWKGRRRRTHAPIHPVSPLESTAQLIIAPAIEVPTPIKTNEAAPELTTMVWEKAEPAKEVLRDPDLMPAWPEAPVVKLPDPFEEDIPHTPVERTEFSSPLNIAAPLHAAEAVRATRLPNDPSLDTTKVWDE